MNGKDLLNSLDYVDDELVQEAEQTKIKKSSAKFLVPMAASFAAVVTAFSIWANHQSTPPMLPNDNIPPIVSEEKPNDSKEYTLHFNKTDSQIAADNLRIKIKNHFWEALTPMQVIKLLPNIAEKYDVEGIVDYSHESGKTSIFGVNTSFKANDNEVKITIAPNEIVKCYLIEGSPVLSEIEGIKIEAGIFTTDKNSRGERNYIYHANFKIDDVAYYAEYAGEVKDKEFFTNIIADIILGGKADLSVVENPIVPELRDEKLTENEVYAEMDFGTYLPEIPKGYQFNSATRFINQTSDYLFASWSQGYEDVHITISKLKEQDQERIATTAISMVSR